MYFDKKFFYTEKYSGRHFWTSIRNFSTKIVNNQYSLEKIRGALKWREGIKQSKYGRRANNRLCLSVGPFRLSKKRLTHRTSTCIRPCFLLIITYLYVIAYSNIGINTTKIIFQESPMLQYGQRFAHMSLKSRLLDWDQQRRGLYRDFILDWEEAAEPFLGDSLSQLMVTN